ncbi:hypothetical protein EPN42_11150 [bacterium]|nr:MAG: hypothetical protein EPN42_11150 [bacterium]
MASQREPHAEAAGYRAVAELRERMHGIKRVNRHDEQRAFERGRDLALARWDAIDAARPTGVHRAIELRRVALACEDLGALACAQHLREYADDCEARADDRD